jgi:hypothetical protein
MDSRTVYYMVETEQEYQEHIAKHPGRVLLCDRSNVQDTFKGKAIVGSRSLHEVCSVVTASNIPEWPENNGPRQWTVKVSDLTCRCIHCRGVATEEGSCKYAPWRNTREVVMLEKPKEVVPESPATEATPVVLEDSTATAELVVESTATTTQEQSTPQNPATETNDNASTNTNSASDTGNGVLDEDMDDDEASDEWWEIEKVYTPDEILHNSPIKCQGDNCFLSACCRWREMHKKEQTWDCCLDCQLKPASSGDGFGGWPNDPSKVPLEYMDTNHRVAMASYCSTDNNWRRHKFPRLPFTTRSRRDGNM